MDALAALCNRASVGRLTGPGPTPEQLETLLRAADRARTTSCCAPGG